MNRLIRLYFSLLLLLVMGVGVPVSAKGGVYRLEDIAVPLMTEIYLNVGGMDSFIGPEHTSGFLNDRFEHVLPGVYSDGYGSSLGNGYVEAYIIDEQGERKYGAIDSTEQIVVPFEYRSIGFLGSDLLEVSKDEGRGVVDKNGNEILPCQYQYIEFCDIYLIVKDKDQKEGLFDLKGNMILPFEYDIPTYDTYDPDTGFIKVGKWEENGKLKHGFANQTGLVIPLIYSDAERFSEGLAFVKDDNGKWGCIDPKGNVVIPFTYDLQKGTTFVGGLATIVNIDHSTDVIDQTGAFVVPVYDTNQVTLSKLNQYGNFGFLSTWQEGYAFFEEKGEDWNITTGVVNQYGEFTARGLPAYQIKYEFFLGLAMGGSPHYSRYSSYFSDGLLSVKLNEKWGAISPTGEVIIELLYDHCFYFHNGYAIVTKEDAGLKQNIIDKQGNLILDRWYDCISIDDFYYICQNNSGETEIRDLNMQVLVSGENWELTDGLETTITHGTFDRIRINEPPHKTYPSIKHFKNNIFTYEKSDGTIGLFAIHKESDEIDVSVNGKLMELDQHSITESDRVLIPMRNIFEALGAEIYWDEENQTIWAWHENDEIKMQINKQELYINDEMIWLDVSPRLVNGVTLVPVRAVSEALGATVQWNEVTKTVLITM